ncbi:MAG TPA: T9SS type A sorting domain-containing protein [Candidatus Marinimicrobia bacterium]|nr:T9SS type A sorting domain-containing protein [Candidatus Neomarinimicrobiota bacterium]
MKKYFPVIIHCLIIHSLVYSNDFSSSQLVSENATPQNFYPDMTVTEDGTIYVIWVNTTDGGDVYFSKSTDHGVTFSEYVAVNQSPNHASSIGFNGPKIAERNDTLHVLWADQRGGYDHTSAYYARSVDGGITWEETQVGHGYGINLYPELMVDSDGIIHAVFHYFQPGSWSYRHIAHTRSTNGGDSWSDFKTVSNYNPGEPCDCCPINLHELPNGQLIAGFRNNLNNIRDMYSVQWNSSNSSWGNLSPMSYDNFYVSYCPASGPSLVSQDSLIGMAYMAESDGESRVYLALSEDMGDTFAVKIPMEMTSVTNVFQNHPSAVITGDGNIHVLWEDSRDNGNILYGVLESGQDFMSDISAVNDSMTNSQEIAPNLGKDAEGYLYAVWVDCRYGRHIRFATTYPIPLSNQGSFTPDQFSVSPAYPNPFNPSTQFDLTLDYASVAQVTVYDITGKEVESIFDGYLEKGYHKIKWQPGSISGGIYLIHFRIGMQEKTYKTIYLK